MEIQLRAISDYPNLFLPKDYSTRRSFQQFQGRILKKGWIYEDVSLVMNYRTIVDMAMCGPPHLPIPKASTLKVQTKPTMAEFVENSRKQIVFPRVCLAEVHLVLHTLVDLNHNMRFPTGSGVFSRNVKCQSAG